MPAITVLLADDHTIVRQGLKTLVNAAPDLNVVGEAETGRLAVKLARDLKPDVIVMDIAMPELNGLEATRQIAAEGGRSRILVLSSYSDDEYITQLMRAGAAGYLLKQTAAADLLNAIREVHQGNTFFSPAISARMLEHYRRTFTNGGALTQSNEAQLTGREREVLQLIAEGNTNKGIADILHVSIKTVEKHRQSLMDRLRIHDIAGLTRYALEKGVIESKPDINPPSTTG